MPKVVTTPAGKVKVLTDEEYQQNLSKIIAAGRKPTDDGLCPKCKNMLRFFTVLNQALLDEESSEIPSFWESFELEYLYNHGIVVCLTCDELPDLIGDPVVLDNSYHDRTH